MTTDPVVNFGKVTVSLPYDSTALSVILQSGNGSKLPDTSVSGPFNLVWWNFTDYPDPSDDPNVEIIRCTTRSVDTLTISRAQEGTLASNKNTAGKTYKMILSPTKKLINDLDVVSGSLSVGGILFADSSGKIVHDYLNLFWDNTNKNIATGTTVPFAGLSSRHGLDITGSQTYQSVQLKNSGTGGNGWELISANNTDINIGGKLAFVANNVIQSVMTSDGKLGVGTTSPGRSLTISQGDIQLHGEKGIYWWNSPNNDNSTMGRILFTDGATGGNLIFYTNNTEKVRIDSSGNVGIGTTTPAQKLHLSGSTDEVVMRIANTGISGRNWSIFSTAGTSTLGQGNLILFDESTGGIAGARLLINPSGNVGIGTTNPQHQLHILSNGGEPFALISNGGVNYQGLYLGYSTLNSRGKIISKEPGISNKPLSIGAQTITIQTSNAGNVEDGTSNVAIYIDPTPNVGIGTTSPGTKLDVNGTIRGTGLTNTSLTTRGPLFAGSGGAITTSMQYGVFAYNSAGMNDITNDLQTQVVLDAEEFDIGGNFASNSFTTPVTGYYLISGSIAWLGASMVADKAYGILIFKNGSPIRDGMFMNGSYLTYVMNSTVTTVARLNAGDTVNMYAWHSAGVNTVDIAGGSRNTFLSIVFLGA